MLSLLRTARSRAFVVLALLGLTVLASERTVERYGDNLQVALPLIAWGCEALNGHAAEYFLRYAVMFTVAHGTKEALGNAPINMRPVGRNQGMPSAHTSTAVLGASSLVHTCLTGQPVVQGVALLAAGFTGASRISADKHDIWQVLAGAILGWTCDRAFRRPSAVRRGIGAGIAALVRLPGRIYRLAEAKISSRS